jgi:hypothetical protein
MAHVAVSAALGPLLVHVNVPVTIEPGTAVAGNDAVAVISALADTLTVLCAELFAVFGSVVVLPAVTVTLTAPDVGAVKLAVHATELPLGSGDDVGTVGKQFTVAPLGNPLTEHAAAPAALGPLLVHVNEPVTTAPGWAVVGNDDVAVMSALADTAVVELAELFAVFGSDVVLPAVTVKLTAPDRGAVKLAVQAIELPLGRGEDVGTDGKQFTLAPPGNPLIEHVAATAALDPLLAQLNVPLTVPPAVAVDGKLNVAAISADGRISSWTCVGAPVGR